jgi:two-component system, chemotaxis family, protein-glutamate methylesterase/glutaminase
MARRDLVVVGASAGGVEALRTLVAGLPGELAAAVLVVLHIPPRAPSALPGILTRSGPLKAVHAADGERLHHGRIYVAPSDRHLLVRDGHIWLSNGPIENGHRPAVDALFRSAAHAHGTRTIGVVLSGARDDGTAGLSSIVSRGGLAIVQDPADALHPSMPRSAIDHVNVDHVEPAREIGPLIASLVGESVDDLDGPSVDELLSAEAQMADMQPLTTDDIPANPAGLACPYCHGALFELDGAPAPRYRCRVGHAWSPQSLIEEQSEAFEGALWMALRVLEEKAALCGRMADSARTRGSVKSAERYQQFSAEADKASGLIRDLITKLDFTSEDSGTAVMSHAADT